MSLSLTHQQLRFLRANHTVPVTLLPQLVAAGRRLAIMTTTDTPITTSSHLTTNASHSNSSDSSDTALYAGHGRGYEALFYMDRSAGRDFEREFGRQGEQQQPPSAAELGFALLNHPDVPACSALIAELNVDYRAGRKPLLLLVDVESLAESQAHRE